MSKLISNIYDFPKQKIPNSQKTKEWAAKCCDWIIAQGVTIKDQSHLEEL